MDVNNNTNILHPALLLIGFQVLGQSQSPVCVMRMHVYMCVHMCARACVHVCVYVCVHEGHWRLVDGGKRLIGGVIRVGSSF